MLSEKEKGEIRVSYRQAAYPKKQIAILAQLYAVPKKEIRSVLGLTEAPQKNREPDKPPVKRRVWTTATRKAVIERVLSGMSCRHAGAPFGVPAHTVGQWMRLYWSDSPEAKTKHK